ncbi:MAG TPA: hypothetical protein VH988_11920 [Thermoanaerobaculia bacterium]|jgi:hypothetical protein|nr:hypothetical protein [Thermoanaerobaculia bacterium]
MTPGPARRRSPDRVASCGDWLGVVGPYLVAPLFAPAAVVRVHDLASHLPGDCAGVLEFRLAPGQSAVDFSLRLTAPAQARPLAAWTLPPHLKGFFRLWAEPEGPFSSLHGVWLEFDLDGAAPAVPLPIVCAKLLPGAGAEWITDRLLPALRGRPLEPLQRSSVARCLDAIPASANLLYVFSLLSRGSGDTVRLEISDLDTEGILKYLQTVAPQTTAWASEGTALLTGVERLHLSLDIGHEILPRIGIEGSFSRLPCHEPGWRELFDRLVDRGLCAAEKRDAALAWPGYDSFWTAPERWPAAPRAVADVCVRSLSHVKVVCRPDRPPEAKVYLMFSPLAPPGSAGAAISSAISSAALT